MQADQVREFALDIARSLDEQKAENIVVFGVRELTPIADYFVIATAGNVRHLASLSSGVKDLVSERGKKLIGEEGTPESGWMLIDTGDIVVHIFDRERRRIYSLEVLWGDAEELTADDGPEAK